MPADFGSSVAVEVSVLDQRCIENVAALHEFRGAVECVRRGFREGGAVFFCVGTVEEGAEFVAFGVFQFAEVWISEKIVRRLPVAEGEGAVGWAEEAGVFGAEPAASFFDDDVGWEIGFGGAEEVCDR